MISIVLTSLAILYYLVWLGQGLVKPWKDTVVLNLEHQLENTTDEQWLNKLKGLIDEKLAMFDRQLANGEITHDEYVEKSTSYFADYKTVREPHGADKDVEYVKATIRRGIRKTKLSIFLAQLAYRLLAGIPLIVFIATGAVQVSLLLSFIFLLTYSVISDIVITRDEEKLKEHSVTDEELFEMDEAGYNISKVILIIYTATMSQIPFLILLLLS